MTQFAVGNNNGQVLMKDIRGGVGPLVEINCHTRPIFRLVFSPNCPSLLASCANEPDVVVMDVQNENSHIIYKDSSHEDFVRGLSWEPKNNRLYSCGWDKLVKSHLVSNSRMELNGQNP
ncbi:methylosome protein 50-like [Limulus polyphemus]|uniref:Methylosome protein 50-like n=1 Tax=Limulus polyphemus TaxID=6850 RepID=A0ABM1BAN2_LIMPO|nr:methylosome protein 50-like [Limulus polyphemus]